MLARIECEGYTLQCSDKVPLRENHTTTNIHRSLTHLSTVIIIYYSNGHVNRWVFGWVSFPRAAFPLALGYFLRSGRPELPSHA